MKNKNEMYLSPAVEEIEMDEESVLCTSGVVDELEDGGVIDWFE